MEQKKFEQQQMFNFQQQKPRQEDELFYASFVDHLTNSRVLNPPPHILKPGKALSFQEVSVVTSELFAPSKNLRPHTS